MSGASCFTRAGKLFLGLKKRRPEVHLCAMISIDELKSNLCPGILEEIARVPAKKCIQSAEAEAKSYLGKYDLEVLFGGALPRRTTAHLQTVIKDIASWRLAKLANPNADLKWFRVNYEDAVKWLKSVQCGQIDPPDWPYPPCRETDREADGNRSVHQSSNRKRRPFF